MGNKLNRPRSFSEADNRHPNRKKPQRSQSTSQVDQRAGCSSRISLPELGGAVPYKPREDVDVDVKLYRSYGNLTRPKSGTLGDPEPDIRYYRRSTEGLPKYASLPRHFGRSKSDAAAVPNGTVNEYRDMQRRTLPYDPGYPEIMARRRGPPGSESGPESQRTSKRVSAASSISSLGKVPINMEDFPTISQIQRKIKCFEDQFCRSLADKYAGLADTLQLSALAIALAKGNNGSFRQVSLLDYLDTNTIPVDLLEQNSEDYILLIPESLFHGLMHVRKDKISELDLWTSLAGDIVTCIGVEAANEISRMFEYQIVLLTGDSAVRVLADHAAACVIEHIKQHNAFLDRNTATIGVIKGNSSITMSGSPKYLSVILGHRELKWNVQEVFKRPSLRKELLLFSATLDEYGSPWHYYTSKDKDPQLYGYRGVLLEWDWVNKVFSVNKQDLKHYDEDITDSLDYPDDFHRMYQPYKRLFGAHVMMRYCSMKTQGKINSSMSQFLTDSSGDATIRDQIQPVYRPLSMPTQPLDFSTCNFDNVDLTRAQLKQADLSRTSIRHSKLLLTDMEEAKFNNMDGSSTKLKGADVSYTTLAESTMDQSTLNDITAKHVVMRPKTRRRTKAKTRSEGSERELPNGHDIGVSRPLSDPSTLPEDPNQTTPLTAKPKKKKKKVQRQINIDDNMMTDTVDGQEPQTLTNGVHGDEMIQETALDLDLDPEDIHPEIHEADEDVVAPHTSYITDSQGNLLEIDQVIEQKQKKLKEKKKKPKKRPLQPMPSTPTETIPETPVFVEEQKVVFVEKERPLNQSHPPQPQTQPSQHTTFDQTQQFFTESSQIQHPIGTEVTKTVRIEQLHDEPGARRVPRVNRAAREGSDASGKSVTDYNILDISQNGDAPLSPVAVENLNNKAPEQEKTEVPGSSEESVNNKTKTKKSKTKGDKTKTKSGDKKKRKSKSSSQDKDDIQMIEGVNQKENLNQSSPGFGRSDPTGTKKVHQSRPTSAIQTSNFPAIDATPVHQPAAAKALSTTNIHHQPHFGSNQPDYPHSGGGLYPRMTKSLSHHGNLAVGTHKLHNLSLDSHGLGLRTARQIYGLSKEDLEFITRSQIFNMIKGLQIENIEGNLPDLAEPFLGRQSERDDVTEMLSSSGRIVTLTGCYGNGKSTLATAVGHEVRKKFVVPMVIDVRGCVSTASIAHRMVRAFGLHFRFKEMNLFYNWLNCHEQRLLFIVDNLDISGEEDTKFSDLLDDIMTNVKNIRILCTCTRHFYKGNMTHEVYRLGNLEYKSVDYLKNQLPDLHEEGLHVLADVCGHNPLTMSIVANTFMAEDVDSGKLFEELTETDSHTLLDRCGLALQNVAGDELELEILRRLACCVLKLLDNIPLAHAELIVAASRFAFSFDAKSVAVASDRKDIEEVEKSLGDLCETGLMLQKEKRYSLHSLVMFVCQSKASQDGLDTLNHYKHIIEELKLVCAKYHSKNCDEAVKIFEANYDNYTDVISKIIEREDVYELCPSFASLEYSLFLAECFPDQVVINFYESFAQEAEANNDVAKQCRALCCLSHKQILDEDKMAAKQTAEDAFQLIQSGGSDITQTERAFCLRCLGKIAWEEKEDRLQAIVLVKRSLDLYKLALGARDLQTIYTNELYAWMLTRRDTHQTARHYYNISDQFVKEMMDEHPLLVEGYDCRRAIWDRQCLFQRAIDTAKKAVEVSKKFYGEHPVTAKMMTHLCEAIIKRGSLNDAINAGINALSIRSKVLGDHMDTGQSYKTLSYLMLRSGQYDEACRFGQSALEVFEKVDTPEQLRLDVKTVMAQARYRLEYKSHVYVELHGRDASKKNLSNGAEDLDISHGAMSVSTVV